MAVLQRDVVSNDPNIRVESIQAVAVGPNLSVWGGLQGEVVGAARTSGYVQVSWTPACGVSPNLAPGRRPRNLNKHCRQAGPSNVSNLEPSQVPQLAPSGRDSINRS